MEETSEADGRRNKRLNFKQREDRISALPDSILQHILSLLPSTKEAIKTSILSKRWQNQWTHVPVLIFDSGTFPNDSGKKFARFVDSTLLQYECSKIKKLHLAYNFESDTNFYKKIRFATRKHVEELILKDDYDDRFSHHYMLPKFLFDNASLVELEMDHCDFMDDWRINWGSLKSFKLEGGRAISIEKIANVLSGSPSLELLELNPYGTGSDCHISSKSLKTLILEEVNFKDDIDFKISCPNLEEFTVHECENVDYNELSDKNIETVLSGCLFLRSLEIDNCCIGRLVIASTSLKKLVLGYLNRDTSLLERSGRVSTIEISCPNLEELVCHGYHCETFELMNGRSLISVTLDFEISPYVGYGEDMDNYIFLQLQTVKGITMGSQFIECGEGMAKQIFEQLEIVETLTLGSWFIKILADIEMGGLCYTWLNNKILTLVGPNFEHPPEIVCALHSSPVLEKLVIKLQDYKNQTPADLSDLNASGENYWNSDGIVVSCLLSHLKTVEIFGFSRHDADAKVELVLNFIRFLLKNARVLEKLVLMISKYEGTVFALNISQKVSRFPRCSQHAIVDLLFHG